MVGAVDRRRAGAFDPAEPTAGGDLGAPFAAACRAVVATAREKQLVRGGSPTSGPVRCVVDFAAIARLQAVRSGAAAVAREADKSLVGGGDALLATQIQRAPGMVVEHRQVVNSLAGHVHQISH